MNGPTVAAITVGALAGYAALLGLMAQTKHADRAATRPGWPGHRSGHPAGTVTYAATIEHAQHLAGAARDAQHDHAGTLADALAGHGHQLDRLDVLDALAGAGLRLEADTNGRAASAYFQALLNLGETR